MQKCAPAFLFAAFVGAHAHADLAHRRSAVVDVVQKVSPAVVYIGTEQIVESRMQGDSFFDEFFGPREHREAVHGLGSGVLIDPSGIIVTNDHVIRGASAIHVVLADGRQLPSEVIGSDANNDLAVLKVISKAPLPYAKLGTSGDLMIGETVVAIGSPFGLSKTVTTGVVSAMGRSFKANGRIYNDFVQTDAAINPGNSGGPLLNVDGEIIGINTAIFASAQGIGFAIPADKVRRIVNELTHFGKVRAAWIGLDVDSLTPEVASHLGWDRTFGAVVLRVDPDSPAERAGIQPGDILSQVGNSPVQDAEDFEVRMRSYPAKVSVPITLFRGGRTSNVNLVPVPFPPKVAESLAWERLGLRVRESQGNVAVSTIRPGSPAFQIGLAPGDVLVRLNNQPMISLDGFREAVASARHSNSVLLLIRRGRRGYHITLPF